MLTVKEDTILTADMVGTLLMAALMGIREPKIQAVWDRMARECRDPRSDHERRIEEGTL